MSVAVSFCRPKQPGNVVALMNLENGEHRWLDCEKSELISARGLAQNAAALYVAGIIPGHCAIAIFDKPALTLRDVLVVDGLADVHSIRLDGTSIIAASTGADEVVRITHDGVGSVVETLWAASPERCDTHHVNSVEFHNGQLLCSAFGPKAGERWKSARSGYVYNISRTTVVVSGLYHPHSLTAREDQLYLCESSRSTVCTIGAPDGSTDDIIRPVAQFASGYTRGLEFSEDAMYVGESVGRTDGTAAVLNWDDPGELFGRCALHQRRLDRRRIPEGHDAARRDFSQTALEIYDILCLP